MTTKELSPSRSTGERVDEPRIESEEDLELAEILDQAQEVGKLTPREYAKARGMNPQLVYYYIRSGALKTERCICGRTVLDVRTADQTLQTKAATRPGVLDTRTDAERSGSGPGDTGGGEA
jgi:hypothetical protein